MQLHIREDDLTDPRLIRFLEDHLGDMHATSPPESVHALDVEGLRRPQIMFWSAWLDDDRRDGGLLDKKLAGCVALQHLTDDHVELKSMRIAPELRGRRMGEKLMLHALQAARARGFVRMSLETGSMEFFRPARTLYERHGFTYCEPFADYRLDVHSVFMTRLL